MTRICRKRVVKNYNWPNGERIRQHLYRSNSLGLGSKGVRKLVESPFIGFVLEPVPGETRSTYNLCHPPLSEPPCGRSCLHYGLRIFVEAGTVQFFFFAASAPS